MQGRAWAGAGLYPHLLEQAREENPVIIRLCNKDIRGLHSFQVYSNDANPYFESSLGWPSPNTRHPQHPAWTHNPSQQPLQPIQTHSYTPSWTYGQYPPTPNNPLGTPSYPAVSPQTPVTPTNASRYSPYSSQPYQQPPPVSAPAHLAPWSQQMQNHQQQQSQYSPIPYVDDRAHYPPPKPFGGSANAPPPKKSAMKRSSSQSAVDKSSGSRRRHTQPSTPGGGGGGSGGHGHGHGRRATEPVVSPVAIPNASVHTRVDDETYTATKLSPRPRDWRADYSTKQGISSYLPKIGKVRTDVEGVA